VSDTNRIERIVLDGDSLGRRTPQIEHDRQVAIFDLLENNVFAPAGCDGGPYALNLALADDRLVFNVSHHDGKSLTSFALPLRSFTRLIRDYLMILDSYHEAIRSASPSRIEAIDMGRRGLHNEAAELLCERLAEKVMLDLDTGRRLFTLICALHVR
jgi:uncharacterized protein (UPF0262 family)